MSKPKKPIVGGAYDSITPYHLAHHPGTKRLVTDGGAGIYCDMADKAKQLDGWWVGHWDGPKQYVDEAKYLATVASPLIAAHPYALNIEHFWYHAGAVDELTVRRSVRRLNHLLMLAQEETTRPVGFYETAFAPAYWMKKPLAQVNDRLAYNIGANGQRLLGSGLIDALDFGTAVCYPRGEASVEDELRFVEAVVGENVRVCGAKPVLAYLQPLAVGGDGGYDADRNLKIMRAARDAGAVGGIGWGWTGFQPLDARCREFMDHVVETWPEPKNP